MSYSSYAALIYAMEIDSWRVMDETSFILESIRIGGAPCVLSMTEKQITEKASKS